MVRHDFAKVMRECNTSKRTQDCCESVVASLCMRDVSAMLCITSLLLSLTIATGHCHSYCLTAITKRHAMDGIESIIAFMHA